MNVKNLKALDSTKNNVIFTQFPYYWAPERSENLVKPMQKNKVIFLGNDMSGFMNALGNNPEIAKRYVKKVNECLDYLRKAYGKDADFFYKPHPADSDEKKYLNLADFKIVEEKENAEMFFWKNKENIKSVFAVNSLGLLSAYSFGINSYAFSEFFRPIFGESLFGSIDDCYAGLPDYFFIRDFNQEPAGYSIPLKSDFSAQSYFKNLINDNDGEIWFIVSATEFIVSLISIANFIKKLRPSVKINLVISRHHRWNLIDSEDLKLYFDNIFFMPRVFYSLKIKKILEAIKVWQKIKRLKLKPNDVIISGSQVEFVENCFISCCPKNQTVGLIMKRDFYANYDTTNSVFSKNRYFKFSKASWFFNKILEPTLGLNKTLFMTYAPGCTAITRYQKPINTIFDNVIIFDIPK